MSQERKFIPIVGAGGSSGGCGSASSCSSGSSCGSGCGNADEQAAQRQAEGWVLRTTIGEPRLSEVVENYRAMGYEVQVEYFEVPAKEGADGGDASCTTCFDEADRSDANRAWGAVYVRRRSEQRSLDEDLF